MCASSSLSASDSCSTIATSHLVLPPRFSRRILFIAHLTLLSSLLAGYLKIYDCSCMALVVFLTSVNYWRHPTKGWRRNFDMLTVAIGFSQHLYRSSSQKDFTVYVGYFTAFGICTMLYALAWRLSYDQNASSLCHCLIHIVSNVGNVWLYLSIY